jgi:protoporphyrinogen oxidase
MYGSRAAAIEPLAGGGFRVSIEAAAGGPRLADGNGSQSAAQVSELLTDGVVLAVPASQAARLAGPAGISDADRWDDLGSSPIVNVHVIYDRQVTSLPFAAAVESPVQWVFDKTRQAGLSEGQYLAVSLSAADSYVDVPAAELRDQFLPALEQLFPTAAGARVTDFFVTRERRATFRQSPGIGALRPGTATSVPGLVLAGAWTDTGWPDTMEGAVRSGQHAADRLVSQLTEPTRGATGGRPAGLAQAEAAADSQQTTAAEAKAAS